jgi:hypothetical protein
MPKPCLGEYLDGKSAGHRPVTVNTLGGELIAKCRQTGEVVLRTDKRTIELQKLGPETT